AQDVTDVQPAAARATRRLIPGSRFGLPPIPAARGPVPSGAVKKNGLLIVAAALAAAATSAAPAHAATCDTNYIGTAGGSWMSTANWSAGKLPTAADNVCIPAGKDEIDIPNSALVSAHLLTSGSRIHIETAARLALADTTGSAQDVSQLAGLDIDGEL